MGLVRPDHTNGDQRDDPLDTQRWSLLVRRHRHTGELSFYRCDSPEPVPLRELVRVAGRTQVETLTNMVRRPDG